MFSSTHVGVGWGGLGGWVYGWGGGMGTPLFGLNGDVPLNRVCFSVSLSEDYSLETLNRDVSSHLLLTK